MLLKLQQLHNQAIQIHEETVRAMQTLEDEIKQMSIEDAVDVAYATREIFNYLDQSRKLAKANHEFAERYVGLKWVMADIPGAIATDYCKATVNQKVQATMPSPTRDRANFLKAAEFFGAPKELLEGERPAFQFDFLGMSDVLTARQKAGLPLPPGIDTEKLYPLFSLTIRSKKGVSE